MKTEFQVKFLNHLLQQKKENEGFTLIELLVVIIIIGILAAIALPSFLNQANKAKESESKQYIGSMNRTQQAYFLEKDDFATRIDLLGLGIKTQTATYTYNIAIGTPKVSVANWSQPANTNTLRAHTGGVSVAQTSATQGSSETTTLAILCQTLKAGAGNANGATLPSASTTTTGPVCNTTGWEQIK